RTSRAGPRARSPPGPDFCQFVAAAVVGPTPGAGAPEGPALWTEAWRPTGPPRHAPCAAAGRAGGRGGSGRPRALPGLWPALARACWPPAGPGLAASGRRAAAAGGAGHRVPDGEAPLRAVREAHPSRAPGRGAAAALRGAPDGGDRAAEWAVPVEP